MFLIKILKVKEYDRKLSFFLNIHFYANEALF